jgi:hypothetical protein
MKSQSKLFYCLFTSVCLSGASSNAALPVIIDQPHDATVVEGSNATLTVDVRRADYIVPAVTSGNLRLWLKADSGVQMDSSNRVSQWQDFSGQANDCFQVSTNKQPQLAIGLNGRPVIRFDGVQDANVGDYLQGTGDVGLTDGFTAFMVYEKADRSVPEEAVVLVGVPMSFNAVRGYYIRSISGIPNEMAFSGWGNDYGSGFRIPVSTPRIWTQVMSSDKRQFQFFDTDGAANFSRAVSTHGLLSPGAGYYVGGLGSQTRNFKGDIAEIIYYQGTLSDADRSAVENYLREKYFTAPGSATLSYQWQFNSADIPDATNSALSLENVQLSQTVNYSVLVNNAEGSVTSSNAFLTVIPNNEAPVAISESFSVDEDNALSINLTATDANGDLLSYNVTSPSNGTLSGTAPNLTYIPNANFHGTDSFTFTVNDGKVDSEEATISITINSVNDAPVAAADSAALSVNEDNSLSLELLAGDADNDSLTYSITPPANGTLSGVAPHLIYTPNQNFHGPDSFTFTVNDGQAESAISTIHISVASVNDVPVAIASVSPLFLFSNEQTENVVIASCDGNAVVVLDGSQSSDVENDPLEFLWADGTNVIGSGQIASNSFAIGTHSIVLMANDGTDSAFTSLTLEVITPAEAVAQLVSIVEDGNLPNNRKQPLKANLNSAVRDFSRCRTAQGINQLKTFQSKINDWITPTDPTLAGELLQISNQIIEAVE